jgi:hypothetical protein
MEAYYFSKAGSYLHSTRYYNPENRSLLHVGCSPIKRTDRQTCKVKAGWSVLAILRRESFKENGD